MNLAARVVRAWRRHVYSWHGRRPWQYGYIDYKNRQIKLALANQALMERFRVGQALSVGYSQRLDERLVEFPWIITHLPTTPGRVLDAGSTINFDYILDQSVWQQKDITIMTLAPEPISFWQRKISYVWGDLRDVPFRDNWFDVITCISTLEHVGMDNAIYTKDQAYREQNQDSYLKVIEEFKRILKPGGRFYLTVPYGIYKQCGFQQVFNREMLQKVMDCFGGTVVEQTFFRYRASGWTKSTQAECDDADYYVYDPAHYDEDYAAAARAVACLILQK